MAVHHVDTTVMGRLGVKTPTNAFWAWLFSPTSFMLFDGFFVSRVAVFCHSWHKEAQSGKNRTDLKLEDFSAIMQSTTRSGNNPNLKVMAKAEQSTLGTKNLIVFASNNRTHCRRYLAFTQILFELRH
uniref:Uncharacterized protein n=1 Tax=Romanomermis culicivorax TaxID=13658 RepID=A0A915K499_ROMCU